MSEPLELIIRLSDGTRRTIVCVPQNEGDGTAADINAHLSPSECKILQVKKTLVDVCPVERQRLIFKGRILDDNDRTLSDYGIVPKSTLFLVKGSSSSTGGTKMSTPAAAATARSNTSPSSTTSAPTIAATTATNNGGFNPWGAGAVSNSNPFAAAGMNPFANNGGGPPSSDQIEQMMNNPMVQAMMDNPQTMQAMMEMQMQSNPQLRQMMESNPQLRHMMEDPALMRQAMDMMRNPQLRQQALRNQDLAMQNIENIPGGFAALSSQYSQIIQPLEESMIPNAEPTSSSGTSSTGAGATGSAMPNPWGNNRSSSSTSNTSGRNSNTNSNVDTAAVNPWAAMMGGARGGTMASPSMMTPGHQPSQEQMEMAMGMLDNPMFQEMLQQQLDQNPDMIRQMLEAQNPILSQMFRNDPQAANDLIRQMMNPTMMRSMLQLQRAMNSGGGSGAASFNPWAGSDVGASGSGSTPPMMNPFMMFPPPGLGMTDNGGGSGLDFSSLLQQMNNSGFTGSTSASVGPPQNPADRFRPQLRSLYDMGFDNEQECLAVLHSVNGNLNRAVDMLLSGDAPPSVSSAPAAPMPASTLSAPAAATSTNTETVSPSSPSSPDTNPKDPEDKKND